MAVKYLERRLNPRIDIDGDMSYKSFDSNEIREGLLEDLSLGGARIWIEQELPAASQLLFRVEANSQDEVDLAFRATLLHMLPRQKRSLYGYGCRIEESTDWPDEQEQPHLRQVKVDA